MAYIESYKCTGGYYHQCIEDLITEDHICFLVEGFIDSQDCTNFNIKYSVAGHPA